MYFKAVLKTESVYNLMPKSFHWIAYILLVYCSLMSYMNYNRFSYEPKEKYIVPMGVIKINFILQIYQKYIVSLKTNLIYYYQIHLYIIYVDIFGMNIFE